MVENGLKPVRPDSRDYHFLPTFGALAFDTKGLPENFSIYGGQIIPNQNMPDGRFNPPLPSLPMGCTGESTAFMCALEDQSLYNPLFTYINTPPGINGDGRDIRDALKSSILIGLQDQTGKIGNNRTAYFNVYGAGAIDDYDAARIALWINQNEKRAVSVGSYFYPEFVGVEGIVSVPSFNTTHASMHNWIVTGWKTIDGKEYLEAITWQGQYIQYFSREIYNGLLQQPYTGAFTVTKMPSNAPIPIGMTAWVDHLTYFIRQLFHL